MPRANMGLLLVKALTKKQRQQTTKKNLRGRVVLASQWAKKRQSGKKKPGENDWLHVTQADLDTLVKLIQTPPAQNQAMKDARALYLTIPQLG